MANEKYVIKNPTLVMNPDATALLPTLNGAVAATTFSNFAKTLTINLTRTDVDVSALGDVADRHGKGGGKHTVTIDFMHARTLSTTLTPLITEFNGDSSTPFRVLPTSTTGVGLDNLQFDFSAVVLQLPIGGARDAAFTSNCTWPIDNQVTITNGVTTWNV